MRAGLLSRLDIIKYLNGNFVCTWILDTAANRLIDEAGDLSARSNTFLVWPHVVSHTRALLDASPSVD